MTTYKPKEYTSTFIDNIPENADELLSYGVDPNSLYPGIGARICVEKNAVAELMLATQFYEDYEPVPEL